MRNRCIYIYIHFCHHPQKVCLEVGPYLNHSDVSSTLFSWVAFWVVEPFGFPTSQLLEAEASVNLDAWKKFQTSAPNGGEKLVIYRGTICKQSP